MIIWPSYHGDTGRGIGTEICELDEVTPPDDLSFGLDAIPNAMYLTFILTVSLLLLSM